MDFSFNKFVEILLTLLKLEVITTQPRSNWQKTDCVRPAWA